MKKTKHFNISVPELGDVPDITQVSNAISDLEDATAGTLEIMKAEMQGTKITLTSVSRKTKRTGYYEGMSIRFKSPQDIEPNYLKTISVDGLGDQTLSVAYKVNRNEYIDIVYEGNKFTAYPVVVQKTDSVSNNSSILVGTAKSVKTAYDKGVEALNKANQAQSSANKAQSTADGKVSKSGDTIDGILYANRFFVKDGDMKGGIYYDSSENRIVLNNTKGGAISFFDDGTTKITAKNLNTSNKEVIQAINELNSGKFSKDGGSIKGATYISTSTGDQLLLQIDGKNMARISSNNFDTFFKNETTGALIQFTNNGNTSITGNNLATKAKEVIAAINELNSKIASHCPYNIGDIYITTNSGNPSTTWLGTTWEKIEGRFLLGTSGGAGAGATGGSMSKSISVANLPSHNHSGSQSEHSHYMFANTTGGSKITESSVKEKAPSYYSVLRAGTDRDDYLIAGNNGSAAYGRTSNAGGGVSVGYTGSGSALDITPSYYTVHIWKRRG